MRAEFIETKARAHRPRRSLADRVYLALLKLAEGRADLLAHSEKPWASITFSGSRHEMTLDFNGTEAVAAGVRFIAALPDHESTIPGQLVADACINSVDHTMVPEPSLVVEVALLLLEEV